MPNHVTNILTIKAASEERKREVMDAIKGAEPDTYIDFNKIIKMPESLAIESGTRGKDGMTLVRLLHKTALTEEENKTLNRLESKYQGEEREKVLKMGETYISNFENYGFTTWYEWSVAHWGTKWNAYEQSLEDDGGSIRFDTAWSSPGPIFERLSRMFPDVTFDVIYADEDAGYNTGREVYKNGLHLSQYPAGGSDEAYDLYLRTHEWASGMLDKVNGEWTWLDE